MSYDQKDPQSILWYAKKLEGNSLVSLGTKRPEEASKKTNKGRFGGTLEKHYFKITPGNAPCIPDFPEAGVELKSSPVINFRKNQEARIKERLKLGHINYIDLAKEEWDDCCLRRKNDNLLFMFYWWKKGQDPFEVQVEQVELYRLIEEDEVKLRADWEYIRNEVRSGRAHLIREGHTEYLVASTSGASSESRKPQPFSSEDAPERSFSLRHGYINELFERFLVKQGKLKKGLSPSLGLPLDTPIIEGLREKFEPFIGKTDVEIAKTLGLKTSKAKHWVDMLTRGIVGLKGRKEAVELLKSDILLRSMRVETSGKPQEHISFKNFSFTQIVEEDWDESEFRGVLHSKMLFVIYRKIGRKLVLESTIAWSMPEKDIETNARWVWEQTRERLQKSGKLVLPRSSENPVAHVRPKGRNGLDRKVDLKGREHVKSCFWLHRDYLQGQLGLRPIEQ